MTTEPYTPDHARWDAFVGWAWRFYGWEGFDQAERDYKLEIGAALAKARESFLSDSPDWLGLVREIMGSPHVPIFRIMIFRFQSLLQSDPAMVAGALRQVWATDDDVPDHTRERVERFVESLRDAPQRIGTPESLAAFFLSAHDPTSYPFYMWTPFNTAYQLAGYPRVSSRAPSADKYGHAVDFLDELIRQARKRGLELRDRLDAQSLVWCVTQTNPEAWDPKTLAELDTYRESGGEPPAGVKPRNSPPPNLPSEPDWNKVASKLLWEAHHLEEIVADLEDKKQMIFYGPPGTGKTFVARAIAAEYKRVGGDFEIVQFHPSYSYEDFVEGFRPSSLDDDGQARFELVDGPLKRVAAAAAKKATEQPGSKFVLVIDELNRGNVAKVFGELYFLLEYREEAINLQYGRKRFRLPDNLLFICTMNTADRSIALVDAALRRRFWFQGFFPDQPPIEGLLRRWLADKQPGAEWVADLVDHANQHLADRDAAIGPSYFMGSHTELEEDHVRRIWRRAVLPYVEEQCYGEPDKLATLRYDALRSELAAATLAADAPAASVEPTADSPSMSDDAAPS